MQFKKTCSGLNYEETEYLCFSLLCYLLFVNEKKLCNSVAINVVAILSFIFLPPIYCDVDGFLSVNMMQGGKSYA